MLTVLMFTLLGFNLLSVEAKWKSLQCTAIDKEITEIKLCKLKIISRYRNSVNIHVMIKQETKQMTVRLEFFKRDNGWKPFLYNISTNLCDFLKNHKNVIIGIFYAYVRPYLGQNYTCPAKANDLLTLDNFEFDINQFRIRFPIETGEYAVHTSFYYRQKLILVIKTSVEYSNYREI